MYTLIRVHPGVALGRFSETSQAIVMKLGANCWCNQHHHLWKTVAQCRTDGSHKTSDSSGSHFYLFQEIFGNEGFDDNELIMYRWKIANKGSVDASCIIKNWVKVCQLQGCCCLTYIDRFYILKYLIVIRWGICI